jgi:hypothetical protein
MAADQEREIADLKARLAALERPAMQPEFGANRVRSGGQKAKPKGNGRTLLMIGGVLIVMVIGAQFIKDPTPTTPAPAADPPQRTDAEALYLAKAVVKRTMRDPESARFGETFVKSPVLPTVCGYVNGRNSFGGYTGEQPFIVVGPIATIGGEPPRSSFVKLWNEYCADHPAKRGPPAKKPRS